MNHIEIPRRFNGPPSSANGGYIGGILADRLGVAAAEVTLRAPPPLDEPLEFRNDDGILTLHDGETLLAEARAIDLQLDVPEVPSLDAAAAAGALGRMRAHARGDNPFRRCFGCGIDRDDGLRIIPTPVGDDAGVVASDWTPSASLAGADGTMPTPVVWTALDCSAGIAWSYRLPETPPLLTARISARIDVPLRAGERYVVIGWPIEQDGRKLHSGTAIVDADGVVRARSRQLWLLPRE